MSGEERREEVLKYLKTSGSPVSGAALAEEFGVSRQVIVQDIALLRASCHQILSTNRGYVCSGKSAVSEVFCVCHADDEIQEELNLIVDCGGTVEDGFVEHEVYGRLRADLKVRSRRQAQEFVDGIKSGKSSPLKNITSGVHYHTVSADSEAVLDSVKEELEKRGFLAR